MRKIWEDHYPEGVDYSMKIPSLSLYEILEQTAECYPHRLAVIDGIQEVTYVELKESVDFLAGSLHASGFTKGERAALMLPNCLEYIIAFYAIQRLGGIVVQVNPLYKDAELEYIVRDSNTSWFIGQSFQREKLKRMGLVESLSIINTDSAHEDGLYYRIGEKKKHVPQLSIDTADDVSVLQYTGGTTGRSKGVMLTHDNVFANVYQDLQFTSNVLDLKRSSEVMLGLIPLYHVYGMGRMNGAIYFASTYIAVPEFQIETIISILRRYRPTIFPAVPTMYIALLNDPRLKKEDVSSFKYCSSGSASLPVEVIQQFEQKLGIHIYEGYGMTETSPTTHRNPGTWKRKPGSVGIPYPLTDAKIVDAETGTKEMPLGEAGELIVKGPQVMKGYWKRQEETAKALRKGWLYTGDLAIMDEEGYFYIVGRKKDLIIASGFNIYPVEVEDVLYQHPSVAEVCVFGIPDPYRGESVKAVIVLKKEESATEQEMREWCSERLTPYKVPRSFGFRKQLPKTSVGKVLRRVLVEQERLKMNANV
ncbi:long-chain-fatty-acid--CoA ligase [Fictibacillus fluitans]|uniref:Long-chain fatty acid--CoA ligase n=1 Tax=Fictibacillus fluitans TaxID=3058422 RepID=A0ABT8HQE7_9BACL|nr:long-chain fatty acid--CoA ligase [Fictibacillus sp. NE201]MDN4522996.1 long-chain fatty acid--CoA ligase [Fictibacillus sp. NE201]